MKDNIEEILKSIGAEAVPDDVQKAARDAASNFSRSLGQTRQPKRRVLLEQIMKSRVMKLAAAAGIIVACVVGISIWENTGSGIALADVLTQIEKVRAVKYEWTFKVFESVDPNKPWYDERGTMLSSKEYGSKAIFGKRDPNGANITGTEQYYCPQKKLEIRIDHVKKTYRRRVTSSQAQNQPSQSQEESFSSLIKEILKTKHESIGRSIINGIEVEGFQTTDPDYRFRGYRYKGPRFTNINEDPRSEAKLWVEVKTLLPVRIEYLTSDTYDGGKTRSFLQEVDYNFQWDVPADAFAFEAPPIPDGHAIQDVFPEPADEENAIEGLKQCVQLFGEYPERIDLTFLWAESEKSETPAALQLKEELKGLTGLERDNKKMDALKPIRFLNKYYIGLAKRNPAYYGQSVTPNDADKVLMQWKVSDKEYGVIYGDLHAETVTPKKLEELEKAFSQ